MGNTKIKLTEFQRKALEYKAKGFKPKSSNLDVPYDFSKSK